jgi:hypothetical protein
MQKESFRAFQPRTNGPETDCDLMEKERPPLGSNLPHTTLVGQSGVMYFLIVYGRYSQNYCEWQGFV